MAVKAWDCHTNVRTKAVSKQMCCFSFCYDSTVMKPSLNENCFSEWIGGMYEPLFIQGSKRKARHHQ